MLRYSDEIIEEVRSSNDIVDVISQYVTLKRSGRNYFGLCPFHKEKSPSFSVSPDKQIYHCFGCGVGGNVFHFLSKIENITFRESIEELAERAGITLPVLDSREDTKQMELKTKVYEINALAAQFYHENLYKPSSKIAQEYIKKRKLDNKTLQSFLIGYSGNFDELYQMLKQKGYTEEQMMASSMIVKSDRGRYLDRFRKRVMFPIQDVRGKIIAFGGRVLDDSKPKYMNSPETIVYSKGRHLFGMNLAKNSGSKKIIIVEGYMDAISLHQRGINNAVASLGTALTEAQGRLLRKYSEQVIIGYDADGAGQAATLRGLEILQNLGCDIRILQIEGAKDPDEFVVKYGPERFNLYVEKAISLIEYKVKMLKKELNIDNANDKIKFLNEIAKLLSKITNELEKEVYVEKIAKEYGISQEAIYAQINKLMYANQKGIKVLEKNTAVPVRKKVEQAEQLSAGTIKREKMLIFLLIAPDYDGYHKINESITIEDIQSEQNKKIIKILYEHFRNGDSNTSNCLDWFVDEEDINYLTSIMAEDFEITDMDKCLVDVIHFYEKERIQKQKNELIKKLESGTLTKEEESKLVQELNRIILTLAKMK